MCENENSVKLYINEFPVYMYTTKCWRSGHTLAYFLFFLTVGLLQLLNKNKFLRSTNLTSQAEQVA